MTNIIIGIAEQIHDSILTSQIIQFENTQILGYPVNSVIKDIVINCIVALLSYLLGFFTKKVSLSLKEKRYRRKIKKTISTINETKDITYSDWGRINNCRILDHGIPKYNMNNINISSTDKYFIWPVPLSKRTELVNDKEFPFREEIQLDGNEKLYNFIKYYYPQISDIESYFGNIAEKTADDFIALKKSGIAQFNKYKYGVYNITSSRTVDEKEDPTLNIRVFITDYFTFRFMENLYHNLTNLNPIPFQISSVTDVNRCIPFLCSIGIGGFILYNNGKEDSLLFSKRQQHLLDKGGEWHYSYEEGFNMDDKNEDNILDISTCMKRGIKEELNISIQQQNAFFVDQGVTELCILIDDRFQIEFLSYARIEFSDLYTIQDMIYAYQSAKDKEIETETIKPVEMSKLQEFMILNKTTPETKALVKMLLARKKNKYI